MKLMDGWMDEFTDLAYEGSRLFLDDMLREELVFQRYYLLESSHTYHVI